MNLIKNAFLTARRRYLAFWQNQKKEFFLVHGGGLLLALVLFYPAFLAPPRDFPVPANFHLAQGRSLKQAAEELKTARLIRSAFWLKNFVIALGGENSLQAGDYFFERPINVWRLAKKISRGQYGLKAVRLTIPEGLNVFELTELLEEKLEDFDREDFLSLAKDKEGYLFPDTYFVSPKIKSQDLIAVLQENFRRKIRTLETEIAQAARPLQDLVIMASILETEARDSENRRKIAGILWKRLAAGLALQVDVTFKYINGKGSAQLTQEDLKIDSPYNTYIHTGLPPTPINNPGLDSLLAALTPLESEYFYFLADRQGQIHYAVSHAEHVKNKRLYLNN